MKIFSINPIQDSKTVNRVITNTYDTYQKYTILPVKAL